MDIFRIDYPSLTSKIRNAVLNDILLKIQNGKGFVIEEMDLIAKVKRNLVNLSDKEFDQYFASITNRYLPGDTKAIELSMTIEYFTKEYDISFLLHGIRDADRNILLPKLKENDTKAIWYRIYKPNSICGLPHRDADFWAVDDLPIVPEGNFSRIKF